VKKNSVCENFPKEELKSLIFLVEYPGPSVTAPKELVSINYV